MTTYVVSSGQTSSGITLNSDDTLSVLSGGTTSETFDASGTVIVLSGGSAVSTTIGSFALEII